MLSLHSTMTTPMPLEGPAGAGKGATGSKRTTAQECALLCYCLVGLMGSYLTWGVLQEKIMTQEYEGPEKRKSHFKDSQFLVFSNRVLGFLITAVYLVAKRQFRHRAPLYKYSFASFSNIMSAWFQYEALKFVNFPTQVLAKSCKIIPVMIMGKIISRNKYEFYEYLIKLGYCPPKLFVSPGSEFNPLDRFLPTEYFHHLRHGRTFLQSAQSRTERFHQLLKCKVVSFGERFNETAQLRFAKLRHFCFGGEVLCQHC